MSSESVSSLKYVGYSWQIGFAYVFNSIVGAGLLALPKAFSETGWLLGILTLSILAVISYITVTFVIEAMSISNAVLRYQSEEKKKLMNMGCDVIVEFQINAAFEGDETENPNACKTDSEVTPSELAVCNNAEAEVKTNKDSVSLKDHKDVIEVNESQATINLRKGINDDTYDTYEITEKLEVGEMSNMFFYKVGVIVYYIAICLYSYGGLSIYACAVSKSLTTIVCGDNCFDGNVTSPCRNVTQISVLYMYRIMLAAFVLTICPLAYFGIKDTKILQIFTTTYRWVCMISMITLAVIKIARGEGKRTTELFVFNNLPNFFGVVVYAFMCQVQIPAILTPVNNKKRLNLLVVLDFICVITFYATILLTAVFAFPQAEIHDLYTLNFVHPHFFKYLLQLFPVFTLAANFPVIAIVLQNNLKKVILTNTAKDYGIFLNRILFPSMVVIPPIWVAYLTTDVGMLVGYTGTYAGAILQYVIPTMLVYCGRRKITRMFGVYENKHQSPFRHQFWIYLVLLWYVVCLVFVTYNKIRGH